MRAAIKSYFESIGWLIATIAKICARRPLAFGYATFLMLVLTVVRYLVTILPLKVILLASHEGVPSYTPFIAPDQKGTWIFGLAVGTLVAFALSQVLGSLIQKVCEKAGTSIMEDAAGLNFVANQAEQASGFFTNLASVLSNAVFWLASAVLFLLISPFTFLVFTAASALSFGLGTLFAVGQGRPFLGRAHKAITERTQTYVATNSALIFLIGFVAVIYPFLAGWEVNMLGALAAIMLLRRTLTSMSNLLRVSIRLISRRQLVDVLMFRNRQFVPAQHPRDKTLASLFTTANRKRLVNQMLTDAGIDTQAATVHWLDPSGAAATRFQVTCDDGSTYQLQVFATGKAHAIDNENSLFSHVSRARVGAPDVVGEAVFGDFRCRLLTYGTGEVINRAEWREMYLKSRIRLATVEPSDELVDLYRSTHRLPYQRLSEELINRTKVAMRDATERKAVRMMIAQLPEIRARLSALPLTLGNVELERPFAVKGAAGTPLFMHWGHWSVDPLGGGILAGVASDELPQVLDTLRVERSDIPASVSIDDVVLSRNVQRLTLQIERGHFGAAIQTMLDIQDPTRRGGDGIAEGIDEQSDAVSQELDEEAGAWH